VSIVVVNQLGHLWFSGYDENVALTFYSADSGTYASLVSDSVSVDEFSLFYFHDLILHLADV
jgi:hypothetical protein